MKKKINLEKYKCFSGKTALITGGTGGLAMSLTRHLLSLNCKVIWTCRNALKTEKCKAELATEFPNAQIDVLPLDLESLESIIAFCDLVQKSGLHVDYFVNNAGAFRMSQKALYGFERHFFVNFVAPYLINSRLQKHFDSCNTTVTAVTSITYMHVKFPSDIEKLNDYKNKILLYGISKRALTLSILCLEKTAAENGLQVKYTLSHPGVSATNIISNYKSSGFKKMATNFMKLFFTRPEIASLSILEAMSKASCETISCPKIQQIWGEPKTIFSRNIRPQELQFVSDICAKAEKLLDNFK